ncbi:hypothetical protein EUX98_g775 [Antrodiella citrinella]|uniref:Rab-GAP TBC domain-containing protein n=1 Tax=Antrodiella citrinella TaxID=2447956 RepID=A0A4S4N348_9APHY|nr:hypothetical protein EUX98_g775 [Antrodiella citrinella]
MEELSDDERNVVLHNGASKAQPNHFDLDDAFEDADDNDVSFDFSPAAVREEMARSMKHEWKVEQDIDDLSVKIGYAVEQDASVSTFDINDSPDQGPVSLSSLQSPQRANQTLPQSRSDSNNEFNDIQLSSEFSSVNLSDLPTPPESVHASPDPEEAEPKEHLSPYSTVQIDYIDALIIPIHFTHSDDTDNRTIQYLHNFRGHPTSHNKIHGSKRTGQSHQKHMADWEVMMKRSRAAEDKRRKALQERRVLREKRIEETVAIWEKEILPDWTIVMRDTRLRKLWWQGIPTKLRATLWQHAVGNALALSKDAFKGYMARATRALTAGTFPAAVLEYIEADITTSLPTLHLFAPGRGPLYQDLKDMLCAWVVARSDEGLGYVPGIAKIGAMLLLNMAPSPAFLVLRNLLERHCMRSFYGGMTSKDDVEAYYRIFDTLLADGMPKIYFNFKQHQISPSAYLPDWLTSLFLDHLPFEACARLWDILLLEGDSFLYRASLGMLAVLEPRLFFPDRKELLDLLKGENKAAIEVAKRDGRVLEGAAKYEIYNVDEETLWERIDDMEEWWKEIKKVTSDIVFAPGAPTYVANITITSTES